MFDPLSQYQRSEYRTRERMTDAKQWRLMNSRPRDERPVSIFSRLSAWIERILPQPQREMHPKHQTREVPAVR